MKKIMIALSITAALFTGMANADTESTTDSWKHATKSAGHDVAAKTDDMQAGMNEKLDNHQAAEENKKDAFDHKVKSSIEDVKADEAERKSDAKDKMEERRDEAKNSTHRKTMKESLNHDENDSPAK